MKSTLVRSPFDAQPRYETVENSSNNTYKNDNNSNINNNNINNINQIPYNNHYIEEEARLRLNLFGFNISPKTKSSTKFYQDEPKSSSPRSPFSIRKVKTVKPEKIVVADKQGKKKSKRKNSGKKKQPLYFKLAKKIYVFQFYLYIFMKISSPGVLAFLTLRAGLLAVKSNR